MQAKMRKRKRKCNLVAYDGSNEYAIWLKEKPTVTVHTRPRPTTHTTDTADLRDRIGDTHLRQRYNLQIDHATQIFGRGRTLFHIENVEWLMHFVYHSFRLTGLYGRAYRNIFDIRVVENELVLPGLPPEFNGYTLLHLSDLHLDIAPGLAEAVVAALDGVAYDTAVITGDYRASTSGAYDLALSETVKVIDHLKSPSYAILGNHDFIEFVPPLERAGLTFLLNESVPLHRGLETIYLSGVDDPHFYETDNLEKARLDIPDDAVSLLLAHSPELYRSAAAAGYDAMLCGHTHAGQICLPGRIPIMNNANCPRCGENLSLSGSSASMR